MKLQPVLVALLLLGIAAPSMAAAGQADGGGGKRQDLAPSPRSPVPPVSGPAHMPPSKAPTVTFCRDKQSAIPDAAFNDFSPISVEFLQQIGAKHGNTIDELKAYRVTLIIPPQHGQIKLLEEQSQDWTYLPMKGYTGADRVAYLVEDQGKQYKVVVNFWVVEVIDETRQVQECDSIDFGTIN